MSDTKGFGPNGTMSQDELNQATGNVRVFTGGGGGGGGAMFLCDKCGAMLADREKHIAFHAAIVEGFDRLAQRIATR